MNMARANCEKKVRIYFFLPSIAGALLPPLLPIEKSGIVARRYTQIFRQVLALIVQMITASKNFSRRIKNQPHKAAYR